jgi:two-component system, OmpR family, sensor kinase
MTLRKKLIFWYTSLIGVILVIFGAALFVFMRLALVNTIDASLRETTDIVIENGGVYIRSEFGAPNDVRVQVPQLDLIAATTTFIQVWRLGETPELVGQSTNLRDYEITPLNTTELHNAGNTDGSSSGVIQDTLINRATYRVLTRTFVLFDEPYAVQAATSLATVNQASRELIIVIVVGMLFAMAGSAMMAMGFADRALKPIGRLTAAAQSIATTDDLKTRLEYEGPADEIGQMNSVFNQMMTRLESLFHVQQRFVADVSHELRTPLTAIRGNLDLIKRYGADQDSLDAIQSEAERMSRLVADLLLLARADYGGLRLDLAPLDLDTTISEVYREARVLAKDRNLTVAIHDFDPVRIEGDADRLKQLFLNLASNAIKFTPEGGSITMNLRRTFNDAVVEVIDTGIGISKEDLGRVFDRFYQADPARVRKGEGSGLGLSIARWITEAHGGRIEVISEVGKGTTFTVFLPHIEEKPVAPHTEVTRPRIGIIRRSTASQTTRIKQ